MKKGALLCFLLGLPLGGYAASDGEPADTSLVKNYYLQEIEVVSNPKSELRLAEFPGSISVFDTRTINDYKIETMKNLSALSPNLYVPDYGSKLISAVYIRGIGSRINSPAVGLYVDNVPYLDKSSFDFDFLDIEKIEVLKGPQGTLYGRNTMAGLVNVYTQSPFERQGTKIRAGYGNYNVFNASVSHLHRINDKVAFSLGGQYRKDNGSFTNSYDGSRCLFSEVIGGRGQFQFRINPRLKINLSADFESSIQEGYPYSAYDKDTRQWGDIAYNDRSSYERTLSTSSLFLQYLHDRFILSSTTGYQFLKDDMHMDQDFTPLSVFTLQQKQRQNAVTQELVLKSPVGKPLQWVSGFFGFYSGLRTRGPVDFKEDGIAYLIEGQTNSQLAALQEQFPSMPSLSLAVDNANLYIDGVYDTPSYGLALFQQLSYDGLFTDGLSVTAGLRLDYENARIRHRTFADEAMHTRVVMNMAGREMSIPLDDIDLGIEGREQMDMWELSPKFELKYKIDRTAFVYASATRGYRSGGYNFQMFSNLIQTQMKTEIMQAAAGMMPPTVQMPDLSSGGELPVRDVISYHPEHSWNYEIGGHASFWNRRVNADLSLFYIDCRDQQISVVSGYGRITKNSGRSASKGLEASVRVVPTDNLQFSAAYGFTDARFVSNNDGEVDYKNNFVPFTPRHTLSVTGGYSIPVRRSWLDTVDIALQYTGQGPVYWTEANDVSQPFYGLLNGNVSFTKKNVSVRLWGKNLLNCRYQAFYFEVMNARNLSRDNGFAQQGRPITFGADITVRF
ncbi:MAG: TonB-dependent receptor [Coprobacter sp.]|nr:TonB-dependent receptor [Coprobacter sp.]